MADLLREFDELPELPEILRAMFSLTDFACEKQRHEESSQLMEALGKRINPRYNKAMREISEENQRLMLVNFDEYWKRNRSLGG